MNQKRIALCFSGQPRTWKKCYNTWKMAFQDYQVDVFCHFWNFNTPSNLLLHETQDFYPKSEIVSPEERAELEAIFQPKSIVWQAVKSNVNVATNKVKNVIAGWTHSQFYSAMKAAWLKRQYELRNGIEYDVVVRMRTDLHFDKSIQIPDVIEPSTLYSVQNLCVDEFGKFRISDIFFMTDSLTYDTIAGGFYDMFSYVDASSVNMNELRFPPESALYYFAIMRGIKNVPTNLHVDFKIMRDQKHLDRAGKLHQYETI
jgi:hypothetical protein